MLTWNATFRYICYSLTMRTISQRELRNDSAAVRVTSSRDRR
jgi:hypothetical protein